MLPAGVAALPPVARSLQALRKHYNYLVHHMDPDNGLLGELFSCEVIDFREMETIRVKCTFFDRNEEILRKLLQKNGDQYFAKFLTALKRVGQQHIVDYLSSCR